MKVKPMKYRVMFTYDEVVEADDVREALIEANLNDLSDVVDFGEITVEPVYD
jgi:hypothetical protein